MRMRPPSPSRAHATLPWITFVLCVAFVAPSTIAVP
jgi:hypothetical protein